MLQQSFAFECSVYQSEPTNSISYVELNSRSDYYTSNDSIAVMYLNARSLRNKFDYLDALIQSVSTKVSVIVVTEHWLDKNETDFYNLPNYSSFCVCRENKTGSGVALYS